MSNRAQLVRACVAGASLIGAVLISNAAFAQQGCCEGGTATGANAWTTGNTTDETPANIAGATARPPVSSFSRQFRATRRRSALKRRRPTLFHCRSRPQL